MQSAAQGPVDIIPLLAVFTTIFHPHDLGQQSNSGFQNELPLRIKMGTEMVSPRKESMEL